MNTYEQLALELGIAITEPEPKAVKETTVKGCPFCGRPIEFIKGGSIHCSRCRALVIIAGDVSDIINTWNTRKKEKRGRQ